MAEISPVRPTRRAAMRRKTVIDSSDEDDSVHGSKAGQDDDDGSEEEYTPAPVRTPRRQSRRKTTNAVVQDTPTAKKTRRPKTNESIAPPTSGPPAELSSRSRSPTKRTSPRKKKASVAAEHSILPIPSLAQATDLSGTLASPPPSRASGSPLADITSASLNEQSQLAEPTKQTMPQTYSQPVLEKPMDIVIRSRALPRMEPAESSGPKSRIVLTDLVLINFKSYAGRQHVGPFHASFSSVVGPNGSGKSNVIDSLLFVFGFRASKMRQGKISALIHNSAAFPDLGFCEVEVHFQEVMDLPGDTREVVPDSKMVVSRKAFKNNSSKYFINGGESNFTTVTTLLRDRGIDLDHKRFLILQGEVESIAQMKPKAANEHDDGLLEYLEDIIGTSKYKTPIQESAAEAETLNEVCVEKSSRVQHVEKERNSLEDKKNKAIAFIKNENELALKQSALYQVYISECGDNMKVTEEAVAQAQARLDAELSKHRGSEDDIKHLEKKFKAESKECETLAKETQSLEKEMGKYDKENVKLEEKRKFVTGKLKKLEKSFQSSRLASSESSGLIAKYNEDIERSATQIADLQASIVTEDKELDKIRDSLKGKTQVFSDQIAQKQKSLEPWAEKITQKQSAIALAQSELDIVRERCNAGAAAVSELQLRIQGLEQSHAAKRTELEGLKTQKANCLKEVSQLQAQFDKHTSEEPNIRARLSTARQKAEEARTSLSTTQSQGNVLSGLSRLHNSGRVQGFHGRLGNLGTIDGQYDVAISTACPSLDNIVVDTVEVGQQCINHLRQNNLGRAMFILLDRLGLRDLSPIDTPEGVPRLFDLVKPKDDKFRLAFYSVMQNTLVAKDLAQANRIAYGAKRWRVVTLDGQLIDKSGTMSGGGTRIARGAMSSKAVADVSANQVTKLEADRDAVEQAFQEFQQRHRELEASLKQAQGQLPRLETEMQKLQLDIESTKKAMADAEKRMVEVEAENHPSKSDESRSAALRQQLGVLEKEVERLHAETATVEDEIKALQEKIMEVGGINLRAQKTIVQGLRNQVKLLTEGTSTAEVARIKAEKQKEKHERSLVDSQGEIEGLQEELETLEAAAKEQSQGAATWRRRVDEAQNALESKREELAAFKADLDAKTAELNETRAVEIEMRNKLEEHQKALAENQKRAGYWNDKWSKISTINVSDLGEDLQDSELPTFTRDELADMDKEGLKAEIAMLEEKTQNVTVELSVLAEYRRRVEEHTARRADLDSALSSRDAVKRRGDDLRRQRLEGFMEGFSTISLRLKEMYQMITMGGNAELELVDSLDPFSEGILFSVMPPKKSWKNISNLSGGEKTLSSLALVFALHHYKPTPLYVMDEIDAALDFRNVSIVASYIKERTKNAQFIVISLRNNMFELASRLVGVYKVNHMTKSVTIENRDYITGRA